LTISGEFTFSIRDKKLNFYDITSSLNLEPTQIIKKGQYLNKFTKAPFDIWLYKREIIEYNDYEFDSLQILLEELLPHSKVINEFKEVYDDVSINCYFRSDMGQIGFELPLNIISKLNRLDLNLNFHILSYGGVEASYDDGSDSL
jgi:hypothetical protein